MPLPTPSWRGRIAYERARREQLARREAIGAGHAPEAVWLLEHPEVYTVGRRPVGLLPSPDQLASRGATLAETERGGLATWHGPGQLVGYLLLDIGRRGLGAKRLVWAVEQGLIDWLGQQGVHAGRRDGLHGVWVEDEKVAALGLHIANGITVHGFALNLTPDLSAFDLIVPCGVGGARTTSVARLRGRAPSVEQAAVGVGRSVVAAIGTVCR